MVIVNQKQEVIMERCKEIVLEMVERMQRREVITGKPIGRNEWYNLINHIGIEFSRKQTSKAPSLAWLETFNNSKEIKGIMSIDKLHRVMWRLQEKNPIKQPDIYSKHQIDVAISEEIGICDRTLRDSKKAMVRMSLIEDKGSDTWKVNIESRRNLGFGNEEVQANNHIIKMRNTEDSLLSA